MSFDQINKLEKKAYDATFVLIRKENNQTWQCMGVLIGNKAITSYHCLSNQHQCDLTSILFPTNHTSCKKIIASSLKHDLTIFSLNDHSLFNDLTINKNPQKPKELINITKDIDNIDLFLDKKSFLKLSIRQCWLKDTDFDYYLPVKLNINSQKIQLASRRIYNCNNRYFTVPGDSGSPIFSIIDNKIKLEGILSATIINRVERKEIKLDIPIYPVDYDSFFVSFSQNFSE